MNKEDLLLYENTSDRHTKVQKKPELIGKSFKSSRFGR